MLKMSWHIVVFICWVSISHAQSDTSAFAFYPYHRGDVRQYRSQYTGSLAYTEFVDSVHFDASSKQRIIYGHTDQGYPTKEMLDSTGNLYNLLFQPSYVHYKLYADSGESWQSGVIQDTIPITAMVVGVYLRNVFGVQTKVKAIRFQYRNSPPPDPPFTLGTDYLAFGFGLIQSQVEPSDNYYLSGATIDSIRYGTIESVTRTSSEPQTIALLSNYPNPFNNSTTIVVHVMKQENLILSVYDMLGRSVAMFVVKALQPGSHEFRLNGTNLASGTYVARITTRSYFVAHKMLLLK